MNNIHIYNLKGEKTEATLSLPVAIVSTEVNQHVFYLCIKSFLASQRQGTHKTKERGEVVASTRKIYSQKGGGKARMGSLKNPLLRGGSGAGVRPRSYDMKINKKTKKLGKRSLINHLFSTGRIQVIADFDMDKAKTSSCLKFLKTFNLVNKKVLILWHQSCPKNLLLSSRNLTYVILQKIKDVNIYQLSNADHIFLMKEAFEPLTKSLL